MSAIMNSDLTEEKRTEIKKFVTTKLDNAAQFAFAIDCIDSEISRRENEKVSLSAFNTPDPNNCYNIPTPHLSPQYSGESKLTQSVIKNTRDHGSKNNELIESYGFDNNTISDRETLKYDLNDISDDKNIEGKIKQKFICNICGKSFPKFQKLSNHEQSHYGVKVKPFSCELCDQRFTRKDNLNKHKKKVHSSDKTVDQKNYKCDKCAKSYDCERYLKRHQQSHAGFIFKCSKCAKPFMHSSSKNVHELKCSFLPQQHRSDYEQGASADNQSCRPGPTHWSYDGKQNRGEYVYGQYGDGYTYSGQYYNMNNQDIMDSNQYYNIDCGEIMNSGQYLYAPMQNNNTDVSNSMSYPYGTSGWEGYSNETVFKR